MIKFRIITFYTILVYTILVRNITFSADENKIDRAREVARGEHKTLNDAFREWLDWYASRSINREEVEALFKKLKYVNARRKFTRDEMNEREGVSVYEHYCLCLRPNFSEKSQDRTGVDRSRSSGKAVGHQLSSGAG